MERRRENRVRDGAETDVRRLRGTACLGRIIDVSTTGMRLWCEEAPNLDEHVSCRVQFARRAANMPLRVVWARRDSDGDGWLCGAVYDPLFANSPRLIDEYWLYLAYKRDHDGGVAWAS